MNKTHYFWKNTAMENKIHIGRMIKEYIDRHNLLRTQVARQMGTPNTAIYAYEKRDSLKTSTILRICHVLKYNFFMDMANSLPPEYGYDHNLSASKDSLISRQEAEIQKLQHENALLKELIMGRK
jgi:transcriptional regulator with XRE-family HTH domain